jgi:hypothetical protein
MGWSSVPSYDLLAAEKKSEALMITIDLEYIPENAAKGMIPGERPNVQWVYCEAMQIGACRLDPSGREVATLDVTVRAHRLFFIPPWLSAMTGMTEERRAEGVAFPEALKQLVDFVGDDDDVWTMHMDWWALSANAKEHRLLLPFKHQFKKLKPKLPDLGITLEDFLVAGFPEVISGGLYKVLGITLPEAPGRKPHDATHDARSLAHSIYFLRREGRLLE